jgi:hypothetical protein
MPDMREDRPLHFYVICFYIFLDGCTHFKVMQLQLNERFIIRRKLLGYSKQGGQDYRSRWDDIKMDFKLIGWEWIDRIHLAQDRNRWTVVNTVMNLWVA